MVNWTSETAEVLEHGSGCTAKQADENRPAMVRSPKLLVFEIFIADASSGWTEIMPDWRLLIEIFSREMVGICGEKEQ